MRFVPYEQLAGIPNVVVDGSATESTVLTLSHWPGSRVDASLAVSNNHLDQDGLMGVWSMIDPDAALSADAFVEGIRLPVVRR